MLYYYIVINMSYMGEIKIVDLSNTRPRNDTSFQYIGNSWENTPNEPSNPYEGIISLGFPDGVPPYVRRGEY